MPTELAGMLAAEALLAKAGVYVHKALDPTDPNDFLVIQQRLADALIGISTRHYRKAIDRALHLLDVDWRKTDLEQRRKVFKAANAEMVKAQHALIKPVVKQFEVFGGNVVRESKKAISGKYDLAIEAKLGEADKRVVKHNAKAQAHYVREASGRRLSDLSERCRIIVSRGMNQGIGNDKIGEQLAKAMQGHADRTDAYWRMIANVFTARSRVYGCLTGFADGEIENYRFTSVLDEATSNQCRFMDGRVFSVKVALDKYQEVADAWDPMEVTKVQPWVQEGTDEEGESYLYYKDRSGNRQRVASVHKDGSFTPHSTDEALQAAGACIPPLHGNCRSTIIPE